MTQILILVGVIVGWLLRDLTTKKITETQRTIKKKILGDKSGLVDWTPPKDDETIASEKVMENLKK